MSRPVIFVCAAHYLPAFKAGGPIQTLANMVERLGSEFDFRIMTGDRDLYENTPLPGVVPGRWTTVGRATVRYLSRAEQSLGSVVKAINSAQYDVLYLNSFFGRAYTVRPLVARRLGLTLRRPVVLAPRGEFSRGALAIKQFKKLSFIRFVRAMGLYRDVIWQASSDDEAADIVRVLGPQRRVVVAPNVAPLTDKSGGNVRWKYRRAGEPLRVCFLSRISAKKNLAYALDVVRRMKVPVHFDIFGPVEDSSYWQKCEQLIRTVREPVSVSYRGVIEHERVGETIGAYDLFLFPTLGENFGHVILESLLAGTPVLIANTTPWRELAIRGVGWDVPLDSIDVFVSIIERVSNMEVAEYRKWRERAHAFGWARCNDSSSLEANRRLFLDLL